MDSVQSTIIILLLVPIAVLVVKNYYTNKRIEKAVKAADEAIDEEIEEFNNMPQDQKEAMMQAAATVTKLDEPADYVSMAAFPLDTESLYDLCLVNYAELDSEDKRRLMSIENEEHEVIRQHVIEVLMERGVIEKRGKQYYMTMRHALKLYKDDKKMDQLKNLESTILLFRKKRK